MTPNLQYQTKLHIVGEGTIDGIRFEYLPMKGERVILKTLERHMEYEVYQIKNEVDLTEGTFITYHLYLARV